MVSGNSISQKQPAVKTCKSRSRVQDVQDTIRLGTIKHDYELKSNDLTDENRNYIEAVTVRLIFALKGLHNAESCGLS